MSARPNEVTALQRTPAAQPPPAVLVWLAVPIVGLTALASIAVDWGDLSTYTQITLLHAGVYAIAVTAVLTLRQAPNALAVILITALLCRALALTAEPHLTTDAYRYVWDGRIQWAGWIPYNHVPADPQLAHLRDAAIFPHINKKEAAVTIYPPFAEMIFMMAVAASDSLRGIKVVLTAMDLLIMGAVLVWLRALSLPLERVLIYAWHPLPIWEFVSQSHIDAAATALLMLTIIAAWHHRQGLAGACLAAAALTKYFPLILLPALWHRWNWKMPITLVACSALIALPYWVAGANSLLGYLGSHLDAEGYRAGWGFHPIWLLRDFALADPPGPLYIAAAVIALAILALYALLSRNAETLKPDHMVLLGAAFTWLTSPHYPWYFAWLVPLLVVHASASVLTMTLLAVTLYIPRAPETITWTHLFALTYYLPIAVAAFALLHQRLWPDGKGLIHPQRFKP